MQTVKHYSELGDDPVIVMNKWYLIMMVGTKLAVFGLAFNRYTWFRRNSAEIISADYNL